MRSPLQASAALAITLALATVLGGCALLPQSRPTPSPTPTPTVSAIDAACDDLEKETTSLGTDLIEANELLATDLAGGAAMIEDIAATFDIAADKVEEEELAELAIEASDEINLFSELINAAVADPTTADVEAITTTGTDIQNTFAAIGDLCDPTTSDDSASAACDEIEDEATAVNAELSDASDLLSTDATGAAEKVAAAAVRFEEATAAVDDEKVADLAGETSDRLNEFSELINTLAADPANPDEVALSAGSTDLNAAFGELATFCDW